MDELDFRIFEELERNARQPVSSLAARLVVSSPTVSKRLQRMIEGGIISFSCMINPLWLGVYPRPVFCLKTVPGKEQEVAQTLQGHKCVQNVNLVSGGYDILAHAIFRDYRTQVEWVKNQLHSIPGIQTFDYVEAFTVLKSPWGYIYGDNVCASSANLHDLDKSERKLIRALEIDPRGSVNSLAKKAHLSRQTVAPKLERLLEDDVVRVVSLIDPTALGFGLRATVFLKLEHDKLDLMADVMASHRRTRHVVTTSGRYNLLVTGAFRDVTELGRFVLEDMRVASGVAARETTIHIGHSVRSFRVMQCLDGQGA